MSMENIIKKAIEGGYKNEKSQCYRCGLRRREVKGFMLPCENDKGFKYKSHLFRRPHNGIGVYILDPLFWQALGKACGWKKYTWETWGNLDVLNLREQTDDEKSNAPWSTNTVPAVRRYTNVYYAMLFHQINLTEGWDKAVEYLEELTK